MFKRKIFDSLLVWKKEYANNYACLLEGARRVGKTTIAEEFAKNEYESYIKIDFSNITTELLDVFSDIANLDRFFLRLQAQTGINLIKGQSVIIFDEIQLYPRARQAIKHLVADGRYHYIETGSLISIKKNVKDILIPSEEYKIAVYPMDYEEFLWATGNNPEVIAKVVHSNKPIGNTTNRSLMRDFRLYMAVGGMPQAIDTYIKSNNINQVDYVKRQIIELYKDDLRKIDPSGRLTDIYSSIPNQLSLNKRRFVITAATEKQITSRDEDRLFDLIDSKIVLPCYNVTKPSVTLFQTRDPDYFKLYIADIGLFTTMILNSGLDINTNLYQKLLSNKLDANLGYLYENVVAQMIVASGRDLFYHTWPKEGSSHNYEVDFLLVSKGKILPIEVKSSKNKNHASIDEFAAKYSHQTGRRILFSQNDFSNDEMLEFKPIYSLPFILKDL